MDASVAATIATGGAPADIDTDEGVLGVIDHGAGQSHLSLFTYTRFGELTASGAPINAWRGQREWRRHRGARRPGRVANRDTA